MRALVILALSGPGFFAQGQAKDEGQATEAGLAREASQASGDDQAAQGVLVFLNGRIYVDADAEPVEELVVPAAQVLAAGKGLDPGSTPPRRVVDLRGAVVVPGLVDAHGHLANLGEFLESVDLVGVPSYAELIARVAEEARRRPAGSWIFGRGWDQTRWKENDFPQHGALSRAVPEHPVFLERIDGHAALVNALALERSGLTGELPEVEGGRFLVDAEGRPTGVLIDRALECVERNIPAPDRATRRRRLLRAQQECLAQGLVAVHDMKLLPEDLDVLRELDRSGELRLRVIGYLWANDGLPEEAVKHPPRSSDLDPASRLRVIGAKLMLDGALGSRGAALLEPYADEPATSGLLQMNQARFDALLEQFAELELQPATHAIGDRANRMVLDAYERAVAKNPRFAELRPRIEHVQVVAPEDWGRFAELGVIPSMQPTHATSDMRWAEARLGERRIAGAYAWKRLGSARSPLAFGSDFPVERVSPLEGLYAARTRMDREGSPRGGWRSDQALDARAALRAFTTGAAFAAREEEQRGKLLPGYHADLTVLDVDPLTCEPRALLAAKVLMTVIDGEVVYERE